MSKKADKERKRREEARREEDKRKQQDRKKDKARKEEERKRQGCCPNEKESLAFSLLSQWMMLCKPVSHGIPLTYSKQ